MAIRSFTPSDPALPMTYPGFVFRALRSEGHAPERLLAGTGLTEEQLSDPQFRCGFAPLRNLFLNALEQTGDPHLGIRLARTFEPTFIGLPAYAAMNASRFSDGLDVLARFFFLAFPAVGFEFPHVGVAPRQGEAAVRLRPKFPFHDIEYFASLSALIAVDGLFRAMLRSHRVISRAETTTAEPDGWSAVAGEIGFPVTFDAAHDRLLFPEELLTRTLPASDPMNHARLVALCERFAAQAGFEVSAVSHVTSWLEETRNLGASQAEAAAALGYSERGLRRQLERSGTSYRKLVDQVRVHRAREMLATQTIPIQAIAFELGFDTASNFGRSFKRWTGTTPKAFRDKQGGRSGAGQN